MPVCICNSSIHTAVFKKPKIAPTASLPPLATKLGEGFTEEMGNYMNQGVQMYQQPQIDPMAQEMMGNRLGQVLGQNMSGY